MVENNEDVPLLNWVKSNVKLYKYVQELYDVYMGHWTRCKHATAEHTGTQETENLHM